MRRIPTFFFLNGKLHKKIKEIAAEDSIVAWNYPEEKRCRYIRGLVRLEFEYAFSLKKVSEFLHVVPGKLKVLIAKGRVHNPMGVSYNLSNKSPQSMWFSETDIMKIRDDLWSLIPKNKFGEPSVVTSLPSPGQLKAEIHKESATYIKNANGEYIRVWR